jgi:phosphate starvation-inducible PhoH-like protein
MPKRKKAPGETTLDQSFRMKKIAPMTDTQSDVFDAYFENYNLFLYGCAGTGKTYISLYLALKEVLNPNSPFRKVYMIRSSVPSRDMGFMPGKLNEKMAVYEAPYIGMINDLFGRGDAYQIITQKGVFEMVSTSFLRGLTFEHCIVIADEIQNCSFQELDTLITRIGNDTKVILCGDIEQCDLYRNKYDTTGLPSFMKILDGMQCFDFVEFQPEDIVRSGLVKEYILQKRKIDRDGNLDTRTQSAA